MSRPRRHALAIELTAYCNQKCGYCYNDWRDAPSGVGSLPRAELLAMVDRALTEVELDHVTLTGGEPFARPDLFDVLEVLRKHDKRAVIISNGGLVTRALAERLAPFSPLFVQVTLNGPDAALHEEHVGPGCFEPTLAGIRALSAAGVEVAGCIVLTRKNARVVGETLALFRDLGVGQVALSRYSPAGFAAEQIAELLPSRSDVVAALLAARPFVAAGGRVQVTMPVPPCVLDPAEFPHVTFSSCPIGTEAQELALGPRGELRACTLHHEALGDLRAEGLASLLEVEPLRRYRDVVPSFCEPCPHKASCLGGCGAAAVAVFGERGLDPFVAQHVDEAFGAALRAARRAGSALIPAARLARRGAAEPA